MATKAKLKIILKANETIVAESDDAVLWGKILHTINNPLKEPEGSTVVEEHDFVEEHAGTAISRFAKTLGIAEALVKGALDPSTEEPYLHLNTHCWEAMTKGTPKRGPGALSPTGMAGTLLALWLRDSGLKVQANQALAAGVLATIGHIDKNPSRGIKNTKWLQARAGGVVILNPAEISAAIAIAKKFCTKNWSNPDLTYDEAVGK